MEKENLLAVLRLQKSKLIGDTIAKKLITVIGEPAQIFREKISSLEKIDGVGPMLIKSLKNKSVLKTAELELDYILKKDVEYTYFLDKNYPAYLKHCSDGPILFFRKGDFKLDNRKIISIVGTRNMTLYGRDFCKEFISEIKAYDPIIVSGFAYGVDICAHKEALKNNLQTIAVLGSGLDCIYPKLHRKYVGEIQNNGGFITEFWHNYEPLREHFLRRNRIIAGMAQATIVIESAQKGGSLVTADIANSYNRDVFAVPGRVNDEFSAGCNALIKQNKAAMLTHPDDLISYLNWDIEQKIHPKGIQKQLFVELSDEEQKVYNYLKAQGNQLLDIIGLETNLPIQKLSSILLSMELKGVIKPLPGKRFEIA